MRTAIPAMHNESRAMKVSVIMPSFNQAAYVEEAIESVLSQNGASVELIFVDGNSTDDTLAKVEPYRKRMAHCISEPDEGQSDALAKGFALATGDFMTWLNTDDLLLPGALADLAKVHQVAPACKWFLGNVVWIDAEGTILHARRGESYRELGPRCGLLTAAGPSAFFTRDLYESVGGINKALHYQMDTELWWRFVMAGNPFGRLERYTWALRLHPEAKVSGAMFRDAQDPKAIAAATAREYEALHVASLRTPMQLGIGKTARRFAAQVQRAASPGYLRSVRESRRWRGQKVYEVFS